MCLNHPELVYKNPAHFCFPCNKVDRENSVQSNHDCTEPYLTTSSSSVQVAYAGGSNLISPFCFGLIA